MGFGCLKSTSYDGASIPMAKLHRQPSPKLLCSLHVSVYGTAHAHRVPQDKTVAKNRTRDPR